MHLPLPPLPAGGAPILISSCCGKDCTTAFNNIHRGGSPLTYREQYLLGPLAAATAAPTGTTAGTTAAPTGTADTSKDGAKETSPAGQADPAAAAQADNAPGTKPDTKETAAGAAANATTAPAAAISAGAAAAIAGTTTIAPASGGTCSMELGGATVAFTACRTVDMPGAPMQLLWKAEQQAGNPAVRACQHRCLPCCCCFWHAGL